MMIASVQGALGLTPVFKCSLTKCYSTDGQGTAAGTHLLFLNLQRAINRFATVAGFKAITVDGFIGSGTVTAFQKAAAWALMKAEPFATGNARYYQITNAIRSVGPIVTSKTMLASVAQQAYDALAMAAEMVDTPTVPTVVVSPGSRPPAPSTPPTFDPSTMPPAPPPSWAKTNWPWLAAGAILLTGLGTATYFVFKPIEEM